MGSSGPGRGVSDPDVPRQVAGRWIVGKKFPRRGEKASASIRTTNWTPHSIQSITRRQPDCCASGSGLSAMIQGCCDLIGGTRFFWWDGLLIPEREALQDGSYDRVWEARLAVAT